MYTSCGRERCCFPRNHREPDAIFPDKVKSRLNGRKSSLVGRLGFKPSWWRHASPGGFDSRILPPSFLLLFLFYTLL
jgi:hypothetical protein